MKAGITLLLIVAGSVFQLLYGQKNADPFGKRDEVYFSFPVVQKDAIKSVSRQVSIDKVRNDTVWAYANRQQFERFKGSGYQITALPHPGDAPGVVMRNKVPLVKGVRTTWNFYPTYQAYETLMTDFQTMYPALCHLETITTLPSGHKILVVKISDNVTTNEAEPEFLYTSSMHGDETTGYILMMQLIEYLLQNYGTNQEVTDLVNGMEIYINPLANPDGTYRGGDNSVSGATRYNINNVDLNRNYPDPQDGEHPDGEVWQPETIAFMNFAAQHDFVASANFHGGVEVVNYPWDTWSTRSADDAWWQLVSREYADVAHLHAVAGYMTYLDNGVTNGYDWYEVAGGRQDYMNWNHHCREFTLEISDTKLLPAAQLPAHWEYNYRSCILFMQQATYGFRGLITDQVTGSPVAAKVMLTGHDADNSEVYSSSLNGDYYRPVKAGTYTIEVSAPCYVTQIFPGRTIADYASSLLHVQLVPGAGVTTAAVSAVTGTGALSGGNVICQGASPVTARGVCWATTINPVATGLHTTDGAGTGSFVSSITGLSPNTAYYVRAYATNLQGTIYGDNLQFSTSCGTTTPPLAENFSTAAIPNCWSLQVSGSGAATNWSVSNTANAGGAAYEMKSTWQNISPATTRLVTPPLNTTGYSQLNLSFRHMLDAYGTGVTLKVQSSADAITWTDEIWSVAATAANIPATAVNTTISSNLNSPSTYIAFTITGNLYQYDYWYVDAVSVTGTSTPTLAVSPPNQTIAPQAAATTFSVTSNASWTANSSQTWCTVTPSGSGNGTITATCSENSTTSQRVANITVNVTGLSPVIVTVTQAAPALSVTPVNQAVGAAAGTTNFTVAANTAWTASVNQTWCSVTPSGTGNSAIVATFTGNTLPSARVAEITVSVNGLTPIVVTVTQEGTTPALSVAPSNQDVAAAAGSTAFAVTSNAAWAAASDQTWCTVTNSGSGNGSITATVAENTSTSTRIASITVTVTGLTPVVVTVTQEGITATEFVLNIRNIEQTAANIFEFDVYLLDADASMPLELATVQLGINFNPAILNGALQTSGMTAIVPGSTALPSNMEPISVNTASAGLIKVAGRSAPGAGNGYIVSQVSPGTRIARLRMTNTLDFTASSTPDLSFNSNTVSNPSYPTRVAIYVGTVNTQLPVIPGINANVQENPALNGPPNLIVSPVNQLVTAVPGSIGYAVSSNAAWTAVSDQPWCSVTPAGYGNGTLTAVYSENTGSSRNAGITVSVTGLPEFTVSLTQEGIAGRILNLNLLIEGLYAGSGTMNPASDDSGQHFGLGIADMITVELHNASTYGTIEYTSGDIEISTSGTAAVSIPPAFNSNYYITIRHRNSIGTTSANPVSFADPVISYAFDLPAKAYGGNMLMMIDGYYVIYSGDVNQDGYVDTGDSSPIDNDQFYFISGYVVTDVNGDGFVDTADGTIVDNNQFFFVGSILP